MKTLIPANVTTPLLQALSRKLRAASHYYQHCCYDPDDYSRERRYNDRSREHDRSRERNDRHDHSREQHRSQGGDYHETRSSSFTSESRSDVHISHY